jgi:hypothetical protein
MTSGYVPLDGRLRAIKIVFTLLAATTLVAAVSDVLEISLLDRLIAGEDVSDSQLDDNDLRQGLIGLVQFAVFVAAVVVFIRWMLQAYKNVDVVARGTRRYGHGWAIGSWFVPFLNLWRPKEIINDIHRGGAGPDRTTLLWVWWAFFLISNWIANIALRGVFSDDTPEELRDGSIATLISDILDVPGAILAILVATALTRGLDERAAALPEPEPEPSPDWSPPPDIPAGTPLPTYPA